MELTDFFLIVGAVILIGFAGRLLRQRTRMPESLFLIVFGLLLGPVSGLATGSAMLELLPIVSVAAMVVIILESGIEFDISGLKSSLGKAAIFTLLIAVLTTIAVAWFLVEFYGWDPANAALVGVICSGTTTITAMSLLKGLEVSDKVRKLILLETIINDFTLILGTVLIIEIIRTSSFEMLEAARFIVSELSVGIIVGLVFALSWRYVLSEWNKTKTLNYISTVGLCFILYHVAPFVGGNPIIAIFAFSLLLGNYCKIYDFIRADRKGGMSDFESVLQSIRSVQTDFSFFIAAFFFVLLGITLDPMLFEKISVFIIIGIVALILVARFLSSVILARMDKDFSQYKMIITVMMPRGYVAAVLAFMPAQQGIEIPLLTDIIVILLVVTTLVAILGTALFARIRKG